MQQFAVRLSFALSFGVHSHTWAPDASSTPLQLWHRYLNERTAATRALPPAHPARDALNNTFERALATMHKMPRIWLEYIDILIAQGYVTRTRRALDRSLAALPVTQHDRIWQVWQPLFGR